MKGTMSVWGSLMTLASLVLATKGLEASEPLTLDEVLSSARRHHPELVVSRAAVDEAEGEELAADGGFDPRLRAGLSSLPVGKYDKSQAFVELRQPTPLWGAELYGRYRNGFGSFASYDGHLETLSAGELTAGLRVPVWRGGPIDARRAAVERAERGVERSQAALAADQLAIENAAASAYFGWVTAGRELDIARALLEVAEERDRAIAARIRRGDQAEIEGVDNLRTVLDRRTNVVAADRRLVQAALSLSLFHRDEDGQPIVAAAEELPDALPEAAPPPDGESLRRDIQRALRTHPELTALARAIDQAAVDLRLAKNAVAPRADVEGWVAKDFGGGRDDLRPLDIGIGVALEVPLLLRTERGKERVAAAKLASLRAKERLLRDSLVASIRGAHAALEAAHQSVALANQARRAAEQVAEAERRRLALGDSDVLTVNLRELAAASAALTEAQALLAYHRARADYVAATNRAQR